MIRGRETVRACRAIRRRLTKCFSLLAACGEVARLTHRASFSRPQLTDHESGVVVALTSHGIRLRTVHLTIEAIGAGICRPARLILWLDPDVDLEDLPSKLKNQVLRGLEIRNSPAKYGPHTKYYPYCEFEEKHLLPLVTADDDILYPAEWLKELRQCAVENPLDIVCHRAHEVRLNTASSFEPYASWPSVKAKSASFLNFATGVSGVWYPAPFLNRLKQDGPGFVSSCPRADDVWLHYQAVSHGWMVRQVSTEPKKYPEIPFTQGVALHKGNTAQGGNDRQLLATYSQEAMRALANEAGVF